MSATNVNTNRAPLTLRSDYVLPTKYSGKRQFVAVLKKNFKLLSTSWCGIFWSLVASVVILGLVIALHIHYLEIYEENSGEDDDTSLYRDYEDFVTLDQAIVNTTYITPSTEKIFPPKTIDKNDTLLVPFLTLVSLLEKIDVGGKPLDSLDNYNVDDLKRDNINVGISLQQIEDLINSNKKEDEEKFDINTLANLEGIGAISPTCLSLDIPPLDIKATVIDNQGVEKEYDYGNSRSASFYGIKDQTPNEPYYTLKNSGRFFKMYIYNETNISKDVYEARKNRVSIKETVSNLSKYCKNLICITPTLISTLKLSSYHTQQISFVILSDYRKKTNSGEIVKQQIIFKEFFASTIFVKSLITTTPKDVVANFSVDPTISSVNFRPEVGSFSIGSIPQPGPSDSKIYIDLVGVKNDSNIFIRINSGSFYLKTDTNPEGILTTAPFTYGKGTETRHLEMESLPINTCNGYLGNYQNLPNYRKTVPFIGQTGPIHAKFDRKKLKEESVPPFDPEKKNENKIHKCYYLKKANEGETSTEVILNPYDDKTGSYDFTTLDQVVDMADNIIYCYANHDYTFGNLSFDPGKYTLRFTIDADPIEDQYETVLHVETIHDNKLDKNIAEKLKVSSNIVYWHNNKSITVKSGAMAINANGLKLIAGYFGFNEDPNDSYILNYNSSDANIPDLCCVESPVYLNYTAKYDPNKDFNNVPKYHLRSSNAIEETKNGSFDIETTRYYEIKKDARAVSVVLENETPITCEADETDEQCIDRLQVSNTKFYTNYLEDSLYENQRNSRIYTHLIKYNEVGYGVNEEQTEVKVGQDIYMETFMFNQTEVIYKVKSFARILNMQQMLFQNMVNYSTDQITSLLVDDWNQPTFTKVPNIKLATQTYWETFGTMKPDEYTPQFCMFLIPFCFLILIPTFSYTHSNDRGEGLNNLHFMMGLKYKNKFFADFIYQIVLGLIFFVVVFCMTYIGGLDAISENTFLITFFDFLLFVLNIPLISILIGCWFETGKTASLISIVVMLVYCIGGILAGMSLTGDDDVFGKTLHWAYSFIPGFSPIAILEEMCAVAVLQEKETYLQASDIRIRDIDGITNRFLIVRYTVGSSITKHFITGYIMTAVWTIIAVYIDRIVPRRHGVPEHWLFPFQRAVRKLDIVKKYLAVKNYLHVETLAYKKSSITHKGPYSNIDLSHVNQNDDDLNKIENSSSDSQSPELSHDKLYIPIPNETINELNGLPFSEEELRLRRDTYLYINQSDVKTFEKIICKTDEELAKIHNYAILSLTNVFASIACFFCHPKLMTMGVNYNTPFGVFLAIHYHQRSAVPEGDDDVDNNNVLSEEPGLITENDKLIDLENDDAEKKLLGYDVFKTAKETYTPRKDFQSAFSEYSQSTSEYVGRNGVLKFGNIKSRKNEALKFMVKDEDVTRERDNTIANRLATNGGKPLVRIIDIKKTYRGTRVSPPKDAVKGIYLTVGENECLGLLGSNGAGKTTLLNMLCMSFKPTAGTAFIDGYDITNPSTRSLIQANLGVCPQFDIHWPTLSCEDHLRFFCKIKGVPSSYEDQHVSDLLQAVGLTQQAKVPSKSLSGGMRRRLSVAMSLCGKPKVLLLDEPSTGLDPENRRGLWNIIIACRPGRATIITSHAMEEVIALCTRATITADGKLRCIGTIPHLQSKFGTGYQLGVHIALNSEDNYLSSNAHVTHKETSSSSYEENNIEPVMVGSIVLSQKLEQTVHTIITQKIPGVKLMSAYYGALIYSIPDSAKISNIFPIMEDLVKDKRSSVCDWSIAQTSLENIFLRVVNESRVE